MEEQKTVRRPLTINMQYIKDLSFENPCAPLIYDDIRGKSPVFKINVDVAVFALKNQSYEIVVSYEVKSLTNKGKTCFMLELQHAGIATLDEDLDDQTKELLLFVEGPRFLFPEVRSILSLVTGNAAFLPLTLHPIDFHQLYLKRKQRDAVAITQGGTVNSGDDKVPDSA